MIGNDQVFGIKRTLDAVEGLQLFALSRTPHNDAAFNLVEIEDMRGLAHRQPGKIRGIDRVGNLFLLEQAEIGSDLCAREPIFRVANRDAAQHTRREAAASLFGFDLDGKRPARTAHALEGLHREH